MLAALVVAGLVAVWPFARLRHSVVGVSCILGGIVALGVLMETGLERFALPSPLDACALAQEVVPAKDAKTTVAAPDVAAVPNESAAAAPEAAVVEDRPVQAEAGVGEVPAQPKTPLELNKVTQPAAEAEKPLAIGSPVTIPPGRPDWVERDFSAEEGDVQRVSISSGPAAKKHEALRQMDAELVAATRDYIAEFTGKSAAATLVPIEVRYIKDHLVKPENTYSEVIGTSVGPMHQVHALVEFNSNFRQHVQDRWNKIVVTGRVMKLGVIAAGVLLALSIVFGYFKADNATRGYHSTRLQLASTVAILALVAGGVFLFRHL
jgi:hypothetical protein